MEFADLALTAALSAGSVAVLYVLTKLIGAKQISEMNLFDYINGITIGSIAAEMATAEHPGFLRALLAMAVYAAASLLLSFIAARSLKLRRLLSGKSLLLLQDGHLYKKNFATARLDLSEFLAQCRLSGYFDLSAIELALLEPNGRVSFLPRPNGRPATADEAGVVLPKQQPLLNVVLDGVALTGNLAYAGKDEAWLRKQLKKQGFDGLGGIFLATLSTEGALRVYPVEGQKPKRDIYQ